MVFVVPTLEPHVYGRYHFGACKFAVNISDPGHAPGTGVVVLRGAVSPDPLFQYPSGPAGLALLFRLPPGMRPVDTRWLTCQLSPYLGLYDGKPTLCVIRPSGNVEVKFRGLSVDGAVFFDGVTFVAETMVPRRPIARRRTRKTR